MNKATTTAHAGTQTDTPKDIWKTYGHWVLLISLAFFPTYPVCNWVTAQRSDTLALYLDAELHIPFIAQSIWIYMSMYLLFFMPPFFLNVRALKALGKRLLIGTLLASAVYLALPSHLGFARIIPDDPLYQQVFTGLFSVDQPHNMVPSLHVVFTSLIIFALVDATRARIGKAAWLIWQMLIIASTLLVHQHHLLDCVTGLAVAFALDRLIRAEGSRTTLPQSLVR